MDVRGKRLKSFQDNTGNAQVCVLKAKNLDNTTETKTVVEIGSQSAKGRIVEFAYKLQIEGYKETTIKSYVKTLKRLSNLGANILNPESVKETIAKQQNWDENTKLFAATAYQCFLNLTLVATWKTPKYTKQEKIPYIPTIEDVNALIAGSGKTLAAFLTLLKETGARKGEAIRSEWTDFDYQRKTVRITAEKNSYPRILPISNQLIAMLERLPKVSKRVFKSNGASMYCNLHTSRARQAHKLNNPRLLKITFHSLRHLKGTTEYHKTHDVIHVQRILGHKSIKSTMLYINIESALYQSIDDDFHVKVAENIDEACKLIESGFDYVTDMEGKKLFKKRK